MRHSKFHLHYIAHDLSFAIPIDLPRTWSSFIIVNFLFQLVTTEKGLWGKALAICRIRLELCRCLWTKINGSNLMPNFIVYHCDAQLHNSIYLSSCDVLDLILLYAVKFAGPDACMLCHVNEKPVLLRFTTNITIIYAVHEFDIYL